LGLTQITHTGRPAVRIPYRDEGGQESAIRFRVAPARVAGNDLRFQWKKGSTPCLYGLWRIKEARQAGRVIVVEGESDAQTLWFHGHPALGLPGAKTWKEAWVRHFDGISEICVVIEPDTGGAAVRKWLAESSIRDRVRLVDLPTKDVSDLHTQDPDAFNDRFNACLMQAHEWADVERQQVQSERQVLEERCAPIRTHPDILELMSETLSNHHVAGEARVAKLLYLAVTSRLLARPVSVALKAQTSAGKSYLAERVLELFFPKTAFYSLTGMSEKALVYSNEPLKHRMLVIFEAVGVQSDFASYLVRSLLSEGRLRYETVLKTEKGLEAILIEREGPTGLIVTTTALRLHPENETRLLSLSVNETPQQTERVLKEIAKGFEARRSEGQAAAARSKGQAVGLEPWHTHQRWLELDTPEVEVPFAGELARLIPPVAVRLRRDFSTLLTLVCAHALLHQSTRRRSESGSVIASLADYAAVRDLVEDLMSQGVEAGVSAIVRETVAAVDQLCRRSASTETTVTEVAKHLQVDRATASRRVRVALDAGYLVNEETRKGRPFKLRVGDPLPEDVEVLPNPSRLAWCCAVADDPWGIDLPPSIDRELDGAVRTLTEVRRRGIRLGRWDNKATLVEPARDATPLLRRAVELHGRRISGLLASGSRWDRVEAERLCGESLQRVVWEQRRRAMAPAQLREGARREIGWAFEIKNLAMLRGALARFEETAF
jgi:hypothetical protein